MFRDGLFNNESFRKKFAYGYFGGLLLGAIVTFLLGAIHQDAWNALDLITLPLAFCTMGLVGVQWFVNENLDQTKRGKLFVFLARVFTLLLMFLMLFMLLFQKMNESTRWLLVFGIVSSNVLWAGFLSYSQYYDSDNLNFPYITLYVSPIVIFLFTLIFNNILSWEFFQGFGMFSYFFPLYPGLVNGSDCTNRHTTCGTIPNLLLSAALCVICVFFSLLNGIFDVGSEVFDARPDGVMYFAPAIITIFYIAMFVLYTLRESSDGKFVGVLAFVLLVITIPLQILAYYIWWLALILIIGVLFIMFLMSGKSSSSVSSKSTKNTKNTSPNVSSSSNSGLSDYDLEGYVEGAVYSHLSGDSCVASSSRRGYGNQILDINLTIYLSTDTDYNYIRNNLNNWIGQYRNYAGKMAAPTDQININVSFRQ